jgi:hypothetical protein
MHNHLRHDKMNYQPCQSDGQDKMLMWASSRLDGPINNNMGRWKDRSWNGTRIE